MVAAPGAAEVTDLAGRADVVLADRSVASLRESGFDWAELSVRSPGLVLVTTTPWGGEGPWADCPATEFTVQAACGATARRGFPDRAPVSAGGRIGEWLAATFGAVGALSAWRHAQRTGQGQVVDVSMLEVLTLCLNGPYQLLAAQWHPQMVVGRTIEIPSIEPAADGPVGFCTQTAQQWQDFTVVIGHAELGEEKGLRSADGRMAARDRVNQLIHGYTRAHTIDEVIEQAVAMRVPVAPVGNAATVRAMDQLVANEVYTRGPDGLDRPRVPYRLSALAARPFGPSPSLGPSPPSGPAVEPWPARQRPAPVAPATERPFAGLRVCDLSAFWAGPFATAYLAALGADVVKVESTKRPDGIRFLGGVAQEPSWEWSMVFAGANPGKRDVTLDLDQPAGRVLAEQLIAGSDIVIENWTPRVLEGFGLGWERVHELNPAAILVRMPAFGLDGPWRDRTGFAMTIEQVSGLAWVTGYPDLPLVPRGPCDPLGGMHTVLAILAALEHRSRTGEGQLIEVPLVETALNIAAEQVLEYQETGVVLEREGNRGQYAAPQGLYPAAGDDQWLAIAVATDDQWQALRAVVPDLDEPRWVDASARRLDHDRIDTVIAAWSAGRDAVDAETSLLVAGVPAAWVRPSHRAHLHPQLPARRFLQPMHHPVTGDSGYPSFPMQFSAFGPHLYRRRPPLLGEHNDEILDELGVSAVERERLREAKVIGERPNWL